MAGPRDAGKKKRGERGRKEELGRPSVLGRATKRERERADARVVRERKRARLVGPRVWLGRAREKRGSRPVLTILFFLFQK
jgi:hypothetical protein